MRKILLSVLAFGLIAGGIYAADVTRFQIPTTKTIVTPPVVKRTSTIAPIMQVKTPPKVTKPTAQQLKEQNNLEAIEAEATPEQMLYLNELLKMKEITNQTPPALQRLLNSVK